MEAHCSHHWHEQEFYPLVEGARLLWAAFALAAPGNPRLHKLRLSANSHHTLPTPQLPQVQPPQRSNSTISDFFFFSAVS